jgi:hypothetical protein
VSDQQGVPLAGALVEVGYRAAVDSGFSIPAARCTDGECWMALRTDAIGRYEATWDPDPGPVFYAVNLAGLVSVSVGGFAPNIQLLPSGAVEIVQNLRMRPTRRIGVGESIAVTVESDSSLCTDLFDTFVMQKRCEFIDVVAPADGTLLVEIRADTGSVVPSVFLKDGTSSAPIEYPNPSMALIPIRGGVHTVMAGVPVGLGPQRLTVSTSMK